MAAVRDFRAEYDKDPAAFARKTQRMWRQTGWILALDFVLIAIATALLLAMIVRAAI
jgi:hypothetical protein